jgi:hypothetical protein
MAGDSPSPTQDHDRLVAAVKAALKGWYKRGIARSPFEGLYLYQRQVAGLSSSVVPAYDATIGLLKYALGKLSQTDETAAALLQDHYASRLTMLQLSLQYARSLSSLYLLQGEAIDSLARVIATLEAEASPAPLDYLLERLPPPSYARLVGIDAPLIRLSSLLAEVTEPWWIVICGMGGLGKTALADALTRHVVGAGHFDGLAWVSAQQVVFSLSGQLTSNNLPGMTAERLLDALYAQIVGGTSARNRLPVNEARAALAGALRAKRHLLVLDNFESAADIDRLIPWLAPLLNPSKVLVTSRLEPTNVTNDFLLYGLPELRREDALTLLHQEARHRDFTSLLADAPLIERIYKMVGGNPLALRLVVGQAYLFGVEVVLEDLTYGRHHSEMLYRYIYQSVWNRLEDHARTVLLTMPLIPEAGASLETLGALSGLGPEALRLPLTQLIQQSLILVQGTAHQRLYTIHNLTRAFLKETILRW